MDVVELGNKIHALEARIGETKSNLCCEFALEHSIANVGDFVTDSTVTIKVEKISWYDSSYTEIVEPSCIYEGPCYTKKGKPYVSGEWRNVYQKNIKKVNNASCN